MAVGLGCVHGFLRAQTEVTAAGEAWKRSPRLWMRVAGAVWPATIRRYLSTIALAHRVANLVNPCSDELVQLEIKGLYNVMSARQRQAKALGWEQIRKFIETAGEGIRADREKALLTVAYDTMARRAGIGRVGR